MAILGITESMTQKGLTYEPQKKWHKNILEDLWFMDLSKKNQIGSMGKTLELLTFCQINNWSFIEKQVSVW